MVSLCKKNLIEIRSLLIKLNDDQYSHKSGILSGSSIGQHVRHILEFYVCLLNGRKTGIANYDNRERDYALENNTSNAIKVIHELLINLSKIEIDSTIILEGNYSSTKQEPLMINSSILRELTYNLEHSIHHQALIKIGLKALNIEYLIDENFGVAPATIRFNTTYSE